MSVGTDGQPWLGVESENSTLLSDFERSLEQQESIATPTSIWPEEILEFYSRLVELMDLSHGWDSYSSQSIRRDAVLGAIHFASSTFLSDESLPFPEVVPTLKGGIQFEWNLANLAIEIEFLSLARAEYLVEDFSASESWEDEVSTDFREVLNHLERLRKA